MRVNIDGSSIELTDKDLVGSGGQGQVFVKGGIAYKIYTDPQYMLPVEKITELSMVQHDRVIKPLKVIRDANRKPIGYTMKAVSGASPLCQLYTRPFRDSHNIGQTSIQALVDTMTEIVRAAHSTNVLLVDLNEMNFLAGGNDFDELFAIDVDSWQTPSFPAQAIMPSVRDPHTPKFNQGSDWYSFAIVTFQLYVGIHPYRGKHPTLKGFDERMKANASVFRKDVRIPACCYPFDVIPADLRTWYEKVFEQGHRAPLGLIGAVHHIASLALPAPTSSASVTVTKVQDLPAPFARSFQTEAGPVTASSGHLNFGPRVIPMDTPEAFVGDAGTGYALWARRGRLAVVRSDTVMPEDIVDADAVVQFGTRVAIKHDGKLSEVSFIDNKARGTFSLAFRQLCQVLPGAKPFKNCLIMEALGAKFLVASPAAKTAYQVKLKELQAFRVVDAKLDGNVLMTSSEQKGVYYRHLFRFDDNFENYDCRSTELQSVPSINFTVTPKGVVVLVDENDQVVLFPKKINGTGMKVVDANGAVLSSDLLYMENDKVMFARNKATYWMQVK